MECEGQQNAGGSLKLQILLVGSPRTLPTKPVGYMTGWCKTSAAVKSLSARGYLDSNPAIASMERSQVNHCERVSLKERFESDELLGEASEDLHAVDYDS